MPVGNPSGYGSPVNLGTRSQVNHNPFNTFGGRTMGTINGRTSRVNLGTQSQVNRNPFNTYGGRTHGGLTTPVTMGPTRRGPAAGTGGGTTTPVTMGPTRRRPPAGPVQEAVNTTKKLSKRGRGLMIGGGAAVIAGLAYSGRRGEGSSGGRTSMSRY